MLFAEFDLKSLIRVVSENLMYQSPLLMVYFGAFVLACIFYRRAPTACLLAIIGVVLMVIANLASPIVFAYVAQQRSELGGLSNRFQYYNIVFTILRAIGTGLMVAAIFNGRPPAPDPYDYRRG